MAYCPKCNGEMPANAITCPHCQYDFSDVATPITPVGFAYSPLADVALIISMLAAALGCCGAIYFTIISLCFGQLMSGLFVGPVAFFLQLGMLVVFLRVQR